MLMMSINGLIEYYSKFPVEIWRINNSASRLAMKREAIREVHRAVNRWMYEG